MIWVALLNAFAAGLNLSLAVWNLAERDYGQVRWRVLWTVIGITGAIYCGVQS